MQKEKQEKIQCPECESKNVRFRFKVNSKEKNNAYANVTEEMQCASCFMDIPANVFIYNTDNEIEDNKKIWAIILQTRAFKSCCSVFKM